MLLLLATKAVSHGFIFGNLKTEHYLLSIFFILMFKPNFLQESLQTNGIVSQRFLSTPQLNEVAESKNIHLLYVVSTLYVSSRGEDFSSLYKDCLARSLIDVGCQHTPFTPNTEHLERGQMQVD